MNQGPQIEEFQVNTMSPQVDRDLEEMCINNLRMLAVDQIELAKSGHPGLPLGAAPMAYVLWTKFLRVNPGNPKWHNRDRFVFSAGHGSALLYALLHLSGFDISLDDLKRFRQWGSKAPGHPEYHIESGIECTTGPLGQGFAMGVGMAVAERFLAARFNTPEFRIVDHFTYGLVSDGDLMEGISAEAASLAGNLKLGKLIYLYDDNHISIEGDTAIAFTDDSAKRFEAYGWHVQRVNDGNDTVAIEQAIRAAQAETERPSLIMTRTHIGYGSPKQDSPSAHGEPLGPEALKATRERFGCPADEPFCVPREALAVFRKAVAKGAALEAAWRDLFAQYGRVCSREAEEFIRVMENTLQDGWADHLPVFAPEDGPMATRSASGKALNAVAEALPQMLGGSADLAPSTKTLINGAADQSADHPEGRNMRFGVREHAMGAVVNGMALHGGVLPYGATFLMFSDYMRPAVRLAALMNTHSIFVFTHDSVAVGEDGPTHQPVEHLISLRAIPNLTVIRPADANETVEAWRLAVERKKPVCLILTRQKLPIIDRSLHASARETARGAYIISNCEGTPDLLLLASGSEVSLAMKAQDKLLETGVRARVVSMPSWEIFAEQPAEYRQSVLPAEIKGRLAVEAGSGLGWHRWVGDHGEVISIDRFGMSAPGGEVMSKFGFNVENVVERATALVNALK